MLATPLAVNDDILLTVHRWTVEDTELVDGMVLDLKASHVAGRVTRVEIKQKLVLYILT